ncbi:MAG TPA: methyltransferase domain-containing protein [Gaiellaceae bacterium]
MTDGGARDRVLERAAVRAGDTVLHVPAGSDSLTFAALGLAGDGWVIAVARSVLRLEELLRAAHEAGAPGIQYLLGDPDVLPLPDASVDVVVGRGVLDGAADPAGAADELHRVLRSGGRVSVAEPLSGTADLGDLFRDAGFEGVQVVAADDCEPGLALVAARRP